MNDYNQMTAVELRAELAKHNIAVPRSAAKSTLIAELAKLAEDTSPLKAAQFLDAVKSHAQDKHEAGWDIELELWSDDEIINAIDAVKTPSGATRCVWLTVKPLVGARKDLLVSLC
jgi:hypothetical protein